MSRLTTLKTLAIAAALTACSTGGESPSAPQQTGVDVLAARVTNPLPAWTVLAGSENFVRDTGDEYISGQCGVEGQIFESNYNGTTGGDATFENYQPRKTACPVGNPFPRSIKVFINGGYRNVPAFNVRTVVDFEVDEVREQNFGIAVEGVTNCARLAWWSTDDGGAGGKITVTRTGDKTWTAITSGVAQCRYGRYNELWGAKVYDVQVSLGLRQTP